jgi:succinate dehydrogenase/fumarate reductase flavoprotein subunit
VKDEVATEGLSPPKSNWALPLEEVLLLPVTVACGITFTFGGLATDPETSSVLRDESGSSISGLYCAGEMVGGLWYDNYLRGVG